MKYKLKYLRPKINKMHSMIMGQIHNVCQIQALREAILSLLEKGSLPPPVTLFVQLPLFKKLMSNMEQGYFVATAEDITQDYPQEYKNMQVLVTALHKLVHVDYETIRAKNPEVSCKIHISRITYALDVLQIITKYPGSTIAKITDWITNYIEKESYNLSQLYDVLPQPLQETLQQPTAHNLLNLSKVKYSDTLHANWQSFATRFQCAQNVFKEHEKLQKSVKQEVMQKLNHIQGSLFHLYRYFERNVVSIFPYTLEKEASRDAVCAFYESEKIALHVLKEETLQENICMKWENIRRTQEALEHIVQRNAQLLPAHFVEMFRHVFSNAQTQSSLWHKKQPMSQLLILGQQTSQVQLLTLLLEQPEHETIETPQKTLFSSLWSFLDVYISLYPLWGSTAQKSFLLEKEWPVLDLLPQTTGMTLAVQHLKKHISYTHKYMKKIPQKGITYPLMQEVLDRIIHMDVPSYVPNWFVFGEWIGLYMYILWQTDNTKNLYPHDIKSFKHIPPLLDAA